MSDGTVFLWGCKAIADYIERSERSTFHLLEQGKLPAGKVGATWVSTKPVLREYLDHLARGGLTPMDGPDDA